MAFKLNWSGEQEKERDACGSVSELIGTVGLFYIALICLGLLFVKLERQHYAGDSASQARAPEAAFIRAMLPYDNGR